MFRLSPHFGVLERTTQPETHPSLVKSVLHTPRIVIDIEPRYCWSLEIRV